MSARRSLLRTAHTIHFQQPQYCWPCGFWQVQPWQLLLGGLQFVGQSGCPTPQISPQPQVAQVNPSGSHFVEPGPSRGGSANTFWDMATTKASTKRQPVIPTNTLSA